MARQIPIPTIHLFPKLDRQLIELLRSLTDDQWNAPTLARQWRVRDIAAHLLDSNLRTISIFRDQYFGDPPTNIQSYQDLVSYLNRLNADWVTAMKRVSPVILVDLLETTGDQFYNCLAQLDPFERAIFSVDWAGQRESLNWFHIAREFTEKWHHQKQIREAIDRDGIMEKDFFQPVIQTFMQALPHAYRHTSAQEKTGIEVVVNSEAGGTWLIEFSELSWRFTNALANRDCRIELDPDTAWKLFTKGISPQEAKKKIQITGSPELSSPIFSMLGVMA